MNLCNLPIEARDAAEKSARIWNRMSPLERALALVEHERNERSLALQFRRVHRALPMVKRPCVAPF